MASASGVTRRAGAPRSAQASPDDAIPADDAESDEAHDASEPGYETEHSDEDKDEPADDDTKVYMLLMHGDVATKNLRAEQLRKGGIYNPKHGYFKRTRVTCTAQEEQSALPAGVINVHEDSEDEAEWGGEQTETH